MGDNHVQVMNTHIVVRLDLRTGFFLKNATVTESIPAIKQKQGKYTGKKLLLDIISYNLCIALRK